MGRITGIHHLCVNAKNMDESIRFYCGFFGFELIDRETCPFGEYAMLTLCGTRLELIEPNEKNAATYGNCGSLAHFGIGVENIDEVVAELKAKGMVFLTEDIGEDPSPMGGLRAICLLGPNDEAINLYEFKRKF